MWLLVSTTYFISLAIPLTALNIEILVIMAH